MEGKDSAIGAERVCVFARPPLRGRVKTRLAATHGADAALACYLAFLADALRAARGARAEVVLYLSEALPQEVTEHREVEEARASLLLLAGDLPWRIQSSGTLGARMAAAFEAQGREGASRVAIIGSDLPLVRASQLDACLDAIGREGDARAVLAPTADGGFWCVAGPVGFSWESAFEGVAWSGGHELQETRDRLLGAGHRVVAGPRGLDVDDAGDLERAAQALETLDEAVGASSRVAIARAIGEVRK